MKLRKSPAGFSETGQGFVKAFCVKLFESYQFGSKMEELFPAYLIMTEKSIRIKEIVNNI
jgi:hypothetical protein